MSLRFDRTTTILFRHSGRDRRRCELLAAEALKVGVTAYLAEHDPQPGTVLAEKVKRNIKGCDAFVVLLTHDTANSAYVHQEVGFALAERKLVIPLVQPRVGGAARHDRGGRVDPFRLRQSQVGLASFASELNRVSEKQPKMPT
jgi:TIR domain